MREIRQSGSEGGGNEQTVSPYPYCRTGPSGRKELITGPEGAFLPAQGETLGNKQRHRKPHDCKPMVIIMDPYPGR